MSDINWEKVETIIDRALDLPEGERQSYIEKACKGQPELKGEVTLMLESISDSEGWLEDPGDYKKEFYEEISEDVELLASGRSLEGKEVGSYTIRRKIGEGGMGSVYLAERSDDEFEHRVAIKIVRHGRATEENMRRFRREQRILAGLNHPGIARLFDGGMTQDGFPYIIMEYVDGMPITEYCNRHSCSVAEKIDLFRQVLEAVRHAHENLVIHRDLKPGNILVNESGTVKILDFGISKLLEEDQEADLTQTGARLLTPKYAAPEQIRQENVTTSTDLYALGIVFYELLCGSTPFQAEDLSSYEFQQLILKEEPRAPGNKASSAKLQKDLKGDIDAIALKAIRKEPDRRYRVANEFLEDLENYRKGLPVTAREDSFSYRSQKFIKRHKSSITVAAGILLLIIGFAGFYTWRVTQERNQAELQAERAEQVTEFMMTLFQGNFPKHSPGEDVPVSAVIDEGLKRLEEEELNPVNRATILAMVAQIKINLGEIEEARRLIDRGMVLVTDSITIHNRSTASVPVIQADLYSYTGNFDQAMESLRMADSLFVANGLTHTSDYRIMKFNMADLLLELRNFAEALKVMNELDLKRFRDNDRGIEARGDYHNYKAIALNSLNRPREALENYAKALEYRKQLFGEENPEIGTIYNNMGNVYYDMEEYERALKYGQRAYEIRKETLGKDHYLTGSSSWLLASINRNKGDYEQALRYVKESLETHQNSLGPGHIRYILVLRGYGDILVKLERFDEALPKIDSALALVEEHYPDNKSFKSYVTSSLAQLYEAREDWGPAADYYSQTLSLMTEALRENHPRIGELLMSYAEMEMKRSGCVNATPLLEQALANRKQNFEEGDAPLEETEKLLEECKSSS